MSIAQPGPSSEEEKKLVGASEGIWIWITNTGGTKGWCVSTLIGALE